MAKKNQPNICSRCFNIVESVDYFTIKIRNDASRIGHSYNICRECLQEPLTDLPRDYLTEAEKIHFGETEEK